MATQVAESDGSVCICMGLCFMNNMIISFSEKEIIFTKFCKQIHCQLKVFLMNERADCTLTQNVL